MLVGGITLAGKPHLLELFKAIEDYPLMKSGKFGDFLTPFSSVTLK